MEVVRIIPSDERKIEHVYERIVEIPVPQIGEAMVVPIVLPEM